MYVYLVNFWAVLDCFGPASKLQWSRIWTLNYISTEPKEKKRRKKKTFTVRSIADKWVEEITEIPEIFYQMHIWWEWTNLGDKTKTWKTTWLYFDFPWTLFRFEFKYFFCMCNMSAEVRFSFQNLRHLCTGERRKDHHCQTLYIKVHSCVSSPLYNSLEALMNTL